MHQLGGIDAAYEALQVRKCGDAQVTGRVAVAATAAVGRTRRERPPRQLGKSLLLKPTKRPRRRRPPPAVYHPSLPNLFAGNEPIDEWLAVDGERGLIERVPAEDAFDFVQRIAREYAQIEEGDHQSVRRVLGRAYFAALKMQREPHEFARLQADPFWKASKPKDPATSKWVLYFIMQARTLSVRLLAGKYVAILDGLMRDQVSPDDLRVARMEGVEAAYESAQARPRLRRLKSQSRRPGGNG
jgi:hypothetical protein